MMTHRPIGRTAVKALQRKGKKDRNNVYFETNTWRRVEWFLARQFRVQSWHQKAFTILDAASDDPAIHMGLGHPASRSSDIHGQVGLLQCLQLNPTRCVNCQLNENLPCFVWSLHFLQWGQSPLCSCSAPMLETGNHSLAVSRTEECLIEHS